MMKLIEGLKEVGFKVVKDDPNRGIYEATIANYMGEELVVRFGNDISGHITAQILKLNGSSKWYYEKTAGQILATVRKIIEYYETYMDFEKTTYEIEEEETMTTETKTTNTIETKNEEEITMKPETNFTLTNGISYKASESGTHYYKTADGKKTRIKKDEYEKAQSEFLSTASEAEAAQAELDKEPCRVEVNSDLHKPAVFRKDCPGCVDCSDCNVTGCVHRDCMRRNPKSEGGLGECPRLDVKEEVEEPTEAEIIAEQEGIEVSDAELELNIRKEQENKPKKVRKPRRSKDIAYDHDGVTLTAKQVDFLTELVKTPEWEDHDGIALVEEICLQIGGQFTDKPMTIGAMISTLCEKHLAIRTRNAAEKGKPVRFSLTPAGVKVAKMLGLA